MDSIFCKLRTWLLLHSQFHHWIIGWQLIQFYGRWHSHPLSSLIGRRVHIVLISHPVLEVIVVGNPVPACWSMHFLCLFGKNNDKKKKNGMKKKEKGYLYIYGQKWKCIFYDGSSLMNSRKTAWIWENLFFWLSSFSM